ncbi:MAG: hypothetical protein ABIY50_04560 [Ignavibacteria bacterium]
MKKLILFFLAITLLLTKINLFAQVATSYTFSSSLGVYNELPGDTVVAIASHTSIDPYQLNDVNYGPNRIPFIFKFNGVNYSDFMINSNGFITFGTTAPGISNYGPISSSETYSGAVSALGLNLIGLFGTTANTSTSSFVLTNVANFKGVVVGAHITAATAIPADTYITAFNTGAGTITMSKAAAIPTAGLVVQISAGSIVRSTQGAAPFRVHTIQFKNFRQYLIIGVNDNFNFQIKLFETTGAINVVYGNMDETTISLFAQVGLRGSINTDYNNRTNSVSLNWAVSSAGTLNNSTSLLSNTVFPGSGRTYIWTRVPPVASQIKIIVQGFYNVGANRLNMRDTVRAYLRNNTAPYNVVDSAKSVIDSLTFSGSFLFANASSGTYYIEMQHRNSIETWSKSSGQVYSVGSAMNYDFTDLITKAYGSNMILRGTKFCIYSGDVNQDGIVDGTDVGTIDNDAADFLSGYVVTDLTGDNFVDGSDYAIADNNASNFVTVMRP